MAMKPARWKPTRILASLQLTVGLLLLMALLVIAGTLLQAGKGIYAAQQEIFQSWVFWLFGVLPLPGMLLVGVLLFVNLLSALIFRLKYKWSGLGLLLIHLGLLVLLGGGFISSQFSHEYVMTLHEGESSGMADSAHEWELAVWTEVEGKRSMLAADIAELRPNRPWRIPGLDLELTVSRFFINCRPSGSAAAGEMDLREAPPAADAAENLPGAIVSVRDPQSGTQPLHLFAGSDTPVIRSYSGRDYHFSLRLKRIILPLRLKLLDFEKTVHPGSEIPKSFASRVEIESAGLRRVARIAMNRPLRHRGYAFYQSAYEENGPRGASSTFAVVRNAGRWLPYISSALIFLGMMLHFIGQMAAAQRKIGAGGKS